MELFHGPTLAFKDFADYAIEQIIRIALQEAILKPFTGGVESFFQGIFGKKALGGSVNAGKPYMVGESGRDHLFTDRQADVARRVLSDLAGRPSHATTRIRQDLIGP